MLFYRSHRSQEADSPRSIKSWCGVHQLRGRIKSLGRKIVLSGRNSGGFGSCETPFRSEE